MSSKFTKSFIIILSVLLFAGLIGFYYFSESDISPAQAASQSIYGYAWSSNIGWIKTRGQTQDGATYGVSLDSTSGNLSGYAWSSNIGWVDFSPSGPYPEDPQYVAQLGGDNKITGWIKAVAGGSEGSGGWDGWIKMSDVILDNCNITGYAWGSDVVGWISFSGQAQDGSLYGVALNSCVPEQEKPNCFLSAYPETLVSPQNKTTLSWGCEPAPAIESCSISEGIGPVAPSGDSRETTVSATTLFILTCRTTDSVIGNFPATVQVTQQPIIIEVPPR